VSVSFSTGKTSERVGLLNDYQKFDYRNPIFIFVAFEPITVQSYIYNT